MSQDVFARRYELLREFQVPMRQEAVAFLGEDLTDVVLHTMTPKAQELMGVTKPLSVAPDVMWLSPEDRLHDELVLKAPRNVEHLQAFTHQKILEIGEKIEEKVEKGLDLQIKNAVYEAKMFEQFECQNRIQFALEMERKALLAAQEKERNEYLMKFQRQLDQLHANNLKELEKTRIKMNKECAIETAKRVAETEAEANRKMIEMEIKWKIQEVLLNVFIEDAQKRLEEAVGETRKDFIQIFKRLFESFVAELEEQRNDLHCTQIAELMHVICVEKTEALQMVFKNQNAFQKSIETLRTQLHESSQFPQTIDCSKTKKYKRLFLEILDQYSKFIEVTLNEAPGQGRFLLPSPNLIKRKLEDDKNQKTLLELLFEPNEAASSCPDEYAFLRFVPCNQECKKPMQLGACTVEPEPSVAEPEPELEPIESSLSCFNYHNHMYASTKHYNEIVDRLHGDQDTVPQPSFTAEHDEDSSSTTSSQQKRDATISLVVEKVIQKLSDDSEPPEDRILKAKKQLSDYIHRVCQNASLSESNRSTKPHPSMLLSVADSLDLISHEHRISKSHDNTIIQIHKNKMTYNCSSTFLPFDAQSRAAEKNVKITVHSDSSKSKGPSTHEDKHRIVALQLQSDEYLRSLQKQPTYMRPTSKSPLQQLSLWKYKVTTPEEWNELFAKVEKSVTDTRTEKRVKLDETESLAMASVQNSATGSDSTIGRNYKKSILRRVDETAKEASGYNRFRVASLLERMERGSAIVDSMTRNFTIN